MANYGVIFFKTQFPIKTILLTLICGVYASQNQNNNNSGGSGGG